MYLLSFPEISDEEEKRFTRLASKMKLNSEIEEIKIEIEKNAIKESIEGIDLSQEVKLLSERKKLLEEEYEEFADDFPYLTLREELARLSLRLQKLEQKKGSISEVVYKSLYDEYLGSFQEVEKNLNEEEKRIREIRHQCENFFEKIDSIKEEFIIRSELGEISEEELNKKLLEFDKQKLRAQVLITVTNDILK